MQHVVKVPFDFLSIQFGRDGEVGDVALSPAVDAVRYPAILFARCLQQVSSVDVE